MCLRDNSLVTGSGPRNGRYTRSLVRGEKALEELRAACTAVDSETSVCGTLCA